MLERNAIDHDDLVSIIFTATDDITAEFPATAARALGLGDVPLLCARELGDRRTACRCAIRVMMHFYGEQPRSELHHVYLEGARVAPRRPPRVTWPVRVAVVGTGLIGGSVGLALAARGFEVVGFDRDERALARAKELGAVTEIASRSTTRSRGADVVIVAVPVGAIADAVVARARRGRAGRHRRRLGEGSGRRRGRARRGPTRRRGSSAATRWPAPSRTASTAPTPTCSSARRGCSRRPPTTDERAYTLVLRVDPRPRRRGRRRSRPSTTTRSSRS